MSAPKTKLPAAVVLLGFTSFFTDVGSEMIFPLLPVFLSSLGAAPAFLGLIEGVADFTASLLKLGSGYVADRTTRKKPMVVFGYAIATFVRPLVALAAAPWHVLAVRVTDRVGKGIRTTPRDAMIAAAAGEKESGRAFGFHQAMDHAGAVIGPLIATTLLALGVGIRDVFWLALIPGLFALGAVLLLREPPPPAAPARAKAAGGKLPPQLRSYLVILALFSIGNSSDAFLLLRAKEVGVPVALIPMVWTVLHLVKVASSSFFGKWSDRFPRVWLITAGWALYAACYLAFGLATEQWQIWVLFAIYGAYYGLTVPAEKAMLKDLSPAHLRGRTYGFYNFIIGATAIPAGVATGYLWQTFDPFIALSLGAVLAGLASVALLLWSRGTPTPAPAQ